MVLIGRWEDLSLCSVETFDDGRCEVDFFPA
jgi:hypothetical protein